MIAGQQPGGVCVERVGTKFLLHLLLLIMYGTVVIAEKSILILTIETVVVSVGLSAGCIRFLSTIRGKNGSSMA